MSSSLTKKQQFWSEHIAKAESSTDTFANYAKENNLSIQQLYQWRNMLKERKNRHLSVKAVFTEVISSQPVLSSSLSLTVNQVQLHFSQLPSPTWLASFLGTQQ